MTVALLTILVIYVTMVYGPIAAWLVELFPTRIRYSGLSLPYHIGNGWFGGFLPATVFAIVAATGDIYSGLWYPVIVAAMSFVVGLLFLPETKDVDITKIKQYRSPALPASGHPAGMLGGGDRHTGFHALHGEAAPTAIARRPSDGLALRKTDERGSDRRQDGNPAHTDVSLTGIHQDHAPLPPIVGDERHARSHLHHGCRDGVHDFGTLHFGEQLGRNVGRPEGHPGPALSGAADRRPPPRWPASGKIGCRSWLQAREKGALQGGGL